MLTSTNPYRAAALLSTVVLLAGAAGCGDDGGDGRETGNPADPPGPSSSTLPAGDRPQEEDVDLPTGTEPAILGTEDVHGWDGDVTVAEELTFEACPDHPEEWDAVEGAVRVELSPADGPTAGLNGIFQEIVTFPDEDAARAYASLLATSLPERAASECPSLTEPDPDVESVDLDIAGEEPFDVGGAALGDQASGQRLRFAPGAGTDVITSMETVTFQKGDVVVTVALFLPLASDLDPVELAAVAYDRLPD